jgi:hypothetical protein
MLFRNIINLFYSYISVISQGKLKKSYNKDDEYDGEKNNDGTSSKNALDEETELVKRKLEAEKARKRTRGPYRKSHVD